VVSIRSVTEKPGCTTETFRRWVRQAERDAGYRPGLTSNECGGSNNWTMWKQLHREEYTIVRCAVGRLMREIRLQRVVRGRAWAITMQGILEGSRLPDFIGRLRRR
jgi:transposase-like protein